jgi:hypothetical protein
MLCGQKLSASYKNLNIYYHIPNNQPLYLVPSLLLPFNAIKRKFFIIHFTFKPQIYVDIFNLFLWRRMTKMFSFNDFLISMQPTLSLMVLIFLSSKNYALATSVLFLYRFKYSPKKTCFHSLSFGYILS